MYPYSCYAYSIVYICKYCVCPHGAYGLPDVGIKVYIYHVTHIPVIRTLRYFILIPPLYKLYLLAGI